MLFQAEPLQTSKAQWLQRFCASAISCRAFSLFWYPGWLSSNLC